VERFEFRGEDPAPVVAAMAELEAAHRGWVNLQPGIRPEDEPPPGSVLGVVFGGVAPEVPVCTWVAGRAGRRGVAPDRIGIQHATGGRAIRRLAEAGVTVPAGWRWVQDHPRRGLVVQVAPGTPAAQVVAFLVAAGEVLSRVPLTGTWLAHVYRPA